MIGVWLLMNKNTLIEYQGDILRVLLIKEKTAYVINCTKMIMPYYLSLEEIVNCSVVDEETLHSRTGFKPPSSDELTEHNKKVINTKFALIMPIIPFVDNEDLRSEMISIISLDNGVSKPTLRRYLIKYLVFNNKNALIINLNREKKLTQDEKNMRWALNKFYYTGFKRTLIFAYRMMLKYKYLDERGQIIPIHPKYHQFRYFYSKYNKKEKELITRDGLGKYQRDARPLLGTIYDFAPCIGTAMLDSTVCDIYLVDDNKNVVGRPILTAAVDAYSGMCLGYSLGWEGGIYSLEHLLQNIIENKVEHCRKFGINIEQNQWNIDSLPLIMITDKGKEYIGNTFIQLSELGVKIIDLPPYRPELKSRVEKFFDIVQNLYKENIYKCGLIYEDFQERGGKDYRKDACLSLNDFNKIILLSIITYNNSTIIDISYNNEMIKDNISPFPATLWNHQKEKYKDNFIEIDSNLLTLTLLPRSIGRFTNKGLIFNKLRYRNDLFKEEYLNGGEIPISYNPDDATYIFVKKNDKWYKFNLISNNYKNMSFAEIDELIKGKKELVKHAQEVSLLEKIKLSNDIEIITSQVDTNGNANIKNISITRDKEKRNNHVIKSIKGGDDNG